MSDLYAVLGVPRDATLGTIRRAFRKKVRSCHPDSGGSVEAFHELKAAYDVLSNPLRRRRYDETGELGDQASGDPHQAKIIETLSAGLDQALLQLNSAGGWRHSDIIPTTVKILAASLSQAEHHRRSFESALDQAKSLKDRFRTSGDDNLMEIVVSRRMAACIHKIDLLSAHIGIIQESIKILISTEIEMPLKISGDVLYQDNQKRSANISPLLDISSLITFK